MKKRKFKLGDVVVFEPKGFNPEYWDNLSETERIKAYGPLGYGQERPKLFVFITEIIQAGGHCVLVDMSDGHVEIMRHTTDFRLAIEDVEI